MRGVIAMLAEKFFLLLETLLSHASDDQPAIMVSATPHVPIKFVVSPATELAPELGEPEIVQAVAAYQMI
jgi:hypothetical protein